MTGHGPPAPGTAPRLRALSGGTGGASRGPSRVGRYLLSGAGAAGDERQHRQAIQQEAAQGDGVGRQPPRDPLHQPAPVGLQPRLQQRAPGRAVAVLLQALQLRRAEGRGQRPGHHHARTTGTDGTGVKEPPPPLGAGLSRAGGSGGRGRRPAAAGVEGNGRPCLGRRAANALAPCPAWAPWPRMRGPSPVAGRAPWPRPAV